MANVEGPLSKWTNVMKGWQYRWFVLDELSGLLSYYTSKDKMMRGARRGCVRLKGAVIGIDDEDDSTFTITVDQKTFHFQARDADEREKWIIALENTILRHSESCKKFDNQTLPSIFDFERKLAETDVYLQILIDQVKSLEERIDSCGDIAAKEKYNVIKVTAEAMIESIKHTIVMLQISKESLRGPVVNSTLYDLLPMPLSRVKVHSSDPSALMAADVPTTNGIETATEAEQLESDDISISQSIATIKLNTDAISSNAAGPLSVNSSLSVHDESSAAVSTAVPGHVPETSYSSSEDEDFFDAEEYRHLSPKSSPDKSSTETTPMETPPGDDGGLIAPPIITSDDDYFDELYDDKDSEGLESLEKHGSIVTHLLSQVRIGMDLTKVVLPTFILERRSLLEMYADFFAHPDLFVRIADLENNQDRMVQVVRWYLSAFHAGRNSEIAKKPYNPILGETFLCHWKVPGLPKTNLTVDDGPLPWITQDNLAFISEQVSHHPPISAFYAEHYGRRISLNGYIWTKSKFLGLSIGVHMIGQAVLSVIDYDEEYIFTFPNGYGRSILTIPWVELGGKVALTCPKTGYSANIEFHTKPFYGGKKHRLTADILAPNEKKPFCTIEGEWNGVMYAKYASGMNEIFVDTKRTPIVKKQVQAIENQTEFESRSLWKDVTYNLKHKYIDEATDAKHKLEQRQRDEAKERKEKGLKWETKFFQEVGEHWVYENALLKRLGASASASASSSTSQEQT